MQLEWPQSANTDRKRMEYLMRVRKLFIDLRNFMGRWYRDGFPTQQDFDDALALQPVPISNYVQTNFIYKDKLSQAEWDDWKSNWHLARHKYSQYYFNLELASNEGKTVWDNEIDMDTVLS